MNEYCRCCGKKVDSSIFQGKLLCHLVSYYSCNECGYFQTEKPFWLNEAYLNPINNSDTGLVLRNIRNANFVLATMDLLSIPNGHKVVDFAGGYGLLVRILRDRGLNAYWFDPFCKNIFAIGFENDTNSGKTGLVTAFEAFEHFEFPLAELEKMFEISGNVLFSTDLIPDPIPNFKDWWYYGEEHGQHVGFFRLKTLNYLAKKYGKYLYTNGTDLHILSDKKINPFLWKSKYTLYSYFPFIMNRKRVSKTWQDFLLMRETVLKNR